MKRRAILYFLMIIFLVAGLAGCQKRFQVANPSLVPQSQIDYDRHAHVIIDVCDPERQALRAKKKFGSEDFEKHVQFFCSAGMKKMEKDFDKIQNDKLKKLIKRYSNGFKPEEN